jgi:hypothetical protein
MKHDDSARIVDEFLQSLLSHWPESNSVSTSAPSTLFIDRADVPHFYENQLVRGFKLHYSKSKNYIKCQKINGFFI